MDGYVRQEALITVGIVAKLVATDLVCHETIVSNPGWAARVDHVLAELITFIADLHYGGGLRSVA